MPAPKAKHLLSSRAKPRKHEFGIVRTDGTVDRLTPPLPAKLNGQVPLAETAEAWERLWTAPVAAVLDLRSDLDTVIRWASLLDEREKAMRGYRRHRLVEGSTGQPRLNPLWQVVKACDVELRALEDRMGLSPKARLQLGITYAEAATSLEELNGLVEDDDADGDEEAADDPRRAIVDATSRTSRPS
ncbi:MAG: P27 family phage terminase small subunit [Acidimicrobiia bacterium]